MKPKEKAEELVDKFRPYVDNTGDDLYYSKEAETEKAKQCALICVDEILQLIDRINEKQQWNLLNNDGWQQVKQEIDKL